MDPYRRFYEPNYIAPPLANPPQASRTGQRSLSPLIPTPASEEVTGYPPPLDMGRVIPDGPPIPGSPYYSRTGNTLQHRTTSVVNPALNGIASIADTYSPPSSYRTDCEYEEYASQPPTRDNPFYPRPLSDYRHASQGQSTLSRLRSVTPSQSEDQSTYVPERHRTSYAPETSRAQPRYHVGGRTRRRSHYAPPRSSRTYEYLGYDGSEGDLTPYQRDRVQSWASNVAPGSPQESVSQAQSHPPQSRHDMSSTQTVTYCMNCKCEMRHFSLRCNDCWDRHTDRLNGLDSSWEPAYCIRCSDEIGETFYLCERHQEDTAFLTEDRTRTLEREGICCYCWDERAEVGSYRCSSCRNRSRQWLVDEAEVGPRRELCVRCERRTTSGTQDMCRTCLDYGRSRFELRR